MQPTRDGMQATAHGLNLAWRTVQSIADGLDLAWRTVNATRDGIQPMRDGLHLAWRTVQPIADGLNLIGRTVTPVICRTSSANIRTSDCSRRADASPAPALAS